MWPLFGSIQVSIITQRHLFLTQKTYLSSLQKYQSSTRKAMETILVGDPRACEHHRNGINSWLQLATHHFRASCSPAFLRVWIPLGLQKTNCGLPRDVVIADGLVTIGKFKQTAAGCHLKCPFLNEQKFESSWQKGFLDLTAWADRKSFPLHFAGCCLLSDTYPDSSLG